MSFVPDFMIIGAPKCGTTSLAAWLSGHKDVFIATPKEPAHFSTDIQTVGAIRDPVAYSALFASAGDDQRTGEASTTYLRSHVAVRLVLDNRPDTRLIVCLRNPVEMMPSVHSQLLRGGREHLADLQDAWEAQDERRYGRKLPAFCPEPADLDYAAACELGAQVDRLLEIAPRDQVHFIFNDDMRADPGAVYRETLAFIGVSDDGRSDFTALNQRSSQRSSAFSQLLSRASAFRRRFWREGSSLGLGALAASLNTSSIIPVKNIDPAFRARLSAHFAADVEILGRLTGRDLSEWIA